MFLLWYFLLAVSWLFHLFIYFFPEEGNSEFILFYVNFFVEFLLILHFGVNLSRLQEDSLDADKIGVHEWDFCL